MTPLTWPDLLPQPEPGSWVQQLFTSGSYYSNLRKATEHVTKELLARSKPDPLLWGDDPRRIQIGALVCKCIQENYFWPNDHFLPEDPFDIACLLPWDDLDIVELVMSFEEVLDLTIDDAEVESWFGATLSTVVARLQALEKRRTVDPSRRRKR
jgi:acyl carrier protein